MLKINLLYSLWNYKISGVYKIQFSDGCFYIGCSKHLRSRASCWDSIFRTGKGIAGVTIGTNMINKIKENIDASFDIIELCHPTDLKEKEAALLYANRDNTLMLSNADCRWTPIIQYNKENGAFVKKHMSMSAAARYIGGHLSKIQDVLSGIKPSYKGMFFIYETDYPKRRDEIIKSRYRVGDKKNGRQIIMYDKDGNEIKRYKKITDAARDNGVSASVVANTIRGRQHTAAGMVFKFG